MPGGKTHEIDFCFLRFPMQHLAARVVDHLERIIVLLQVFGLDGQNIVLGMGIIIGPLEGVQIDKVGL